MTQSGSLRPALEALLVVIDEAATTDELAAAAEAPVDVVGEALRALAAEYDADQRGFELREGVSGWRLYSRAAEAPVVERLLTDARQARLTQAALETLAVVAYRQPVSRARISAIRGVNVDAVVRTLVARGLVREAGTEAGSGAVLYETTELFLDRLGLRSHNELPELTDLVPEIEEMDAFDG